MKKQNAQPVSNSGATEEEKVQPLTGKPHFHAVLSKSQIGPVYQLILPTKMQAMLPCTTVPVVLTCCGKSWETLYLGDRVCKKFDGNWKKFVIDNNLKEGDACVFELMEFSASNLEFKVQILRCNFPPELVPNEDGETPENAITIG